MKNNPPGPLSLQQQPTEDVYQGERARSRWGEVQRQAETRATATHGDTLLSWVAHSSKEKSNCVPGSRWGQVCPRQTAGKVSPTCKVKWETLVWVASVGLLQDPHCFWSLPYLVNPHFWHVLPLCLRPRSSCQAVLSFHLLCPSIHISTSVSYLMFIIQNTNTPSLCQKKKAHSVKCSLHKPEDPGLIPSTHTESWTWWHMLPIPGLRRWISGNS